MRLVAMGFALAIGLSGCGARTASAPEQAIYQPPGPIELPRYTPHVTTSAPAPVITATPGSAGPGVVPTRPPTPTISPHQYYTVQPNETLYDVAAKFHVPIDELAAVNHITDPTQVKPGDRLIIP